MDIPIATMASDPLLANMEVSSVPNNFTADSDCRHIVPMHVRGIDMAIGSSGIVGNIFVIIVILASTTLKKKSHNIFILNQSSIDLLVSIFVLAYSINPNQGDALITDEIFCRLWLSKLPLWAMMLASTYNLVALAIVQYLSVIKPVCYKVRFTRNVLIVLLVLPWVAGLGYNFAYILPTTAIHDGMCCTNQDWTSDAARGIFGIFTALIQFFLPLSIIIYCYSHIVARLRKYIGRSDSKTQVNATAPTKDPILSKAKRNSSITLVVVSVCFALCWIFNQVIYLMYNLGFRENYTSIWYHFTVLLVNLNCCINPIIYGLKYDQFRHEVRRLFRRSTESSEDDDDHTSCDWQKQQRIGRPDGSTGTPLQITR